jgi:hypothetical protein
MAIEAGTRITSAAAHGKHGHSLISEAKFQQLYELALQVQLAGEARLRGCEAAMAGVAADLRSDDVVVAECAASVAEIARGHFGVAMDRRSFEERVIEALSDAVGDRMRKTGRITAIFFDAAQGSKVLQEARAVAIGAKLPVILVEHGPAKAKRGGSKKAKKAAALEYPSIPVDTQDVIAMYRVAHESIARAREGAGPTHMVSVRWQTVVAGKRVRVKAQNAVQHLEEWLLARGLPVQQWRREIVAAYEASGDGRDRGAIDAADSRIEDQDTEARAIA